MNNRLDTMQTHEEKNTQVQRMYDNSWCDSSGGARGGYLPIPSRPMKLLNWNRQGFGVALNSKFVSFNLLRSMGIFSGTDTLRQCDISYKIKVQIHVYLLNILYIYIAVIHIFFISF